MTQEELIARLSYFLNPNNGIGAALYFVLKEDDNTSIRFVDIENEAKNELKDRFLEYLQEKFIDNEDLSYQNISETDDRRNVVYRYDLEEKPESLNVLDEILANEEQATFRFNQDNIQHLHGYLITIGNENNKLILYKKHHPINLLKRDRFMLRPSNQRLVKIDDDVLALDRSFDFMMVDNTLIVLKLAILERFFGFDEVIKNQAQTTIATIEAGELLHDIEQLSELIHNITTARKLMKVRNSPVLQVPVMNVINFVRNHPKLAGRIQFNDDGSRLVLDTAVSKKLFLKLLNDDYLFSQLTDLQYDSIAKDKINQEQA